jgi:hypothetical protein
LKRAGIELDIVPSMVARAIEESLKENVKLLELDVNERSITHKIAEQLQKVFREYDFDVDCEYNRDRHEPKLLDLPIDMVATNETEAKTVYPDIIVHKRDSKENLVVIEAKKSTNSDTEIDVLKLKQFKKKLGYSFCYQLKIEVGKSVDRTNPRFKLVEIS